MNGNGWSLRHTLPGSIGIPLRHLLECGQFMGYLDSSLATDLLCSRYGVRSDHSIRTRGEHEPAQPCMDRPTKTLVGNQVDYPTSQVNQNSDSEAIPTRTIPAVEFRPSIQNSVVRRRKPAVIQPSSPEPISHQPERPAVPGTGAVANRLPGRPRISTYLHAVHMFLIAPPLFHDKAAGWNVNRLENRLCCCGNSSSVHHPEHQGFVILSGVFAFFGLVRVYTVLLASHIGDSKEEFSQWFLDHLDVIAQSQASWNRSTMMSLPLTWMCWALLSLLFSLASLGVQMFIPDLQPMTTDSPSTSNTNTPGPNSAPSAIPLSISQLVILMLVTGWSSAYVVMIHLEIRKYRAWRSGHPGEMEMGLRNRDE
ncbi:hypothetical protein B0H14DRAFT_2583726 [Mycena olivaceomarginata]|nr:hypothetical protein B0H14DRAFT_2583726 [Mycena olivaceomarginata]